MVKNLTASLLIIFIIAGSSVTRAEKLSKYSRVSLLTFLPGHEVAMLFGHSAIRIYDPVNQIDFTYNFGMFNFDTPFFYLKFIKGNLLYQLSRSDYQQEKFNGFMEGRTIYEQTLNTTPEENQVIFDKLEKIYHSDNRYYRYNFFFDNCATRIRDIVETSLEGKIVYDTTNFTGKTFRDLLHPYLKDHYWLNVGINTTLGSLADNSADSREYMFLPEYVMHIFAHASLIRQKDTVKLTTPPQIIVKGNITPPDNNRYMKYIPWCINVVLILLMFYEIHRKKYLKKLDAIILGMYGLTGIVLLFLWIYSDHAALHNNFNLVWLSPIYLPLTVLVWNNKKTKLIFYTSLAILFSIILLITGQNIFPQHIPSQLFPFVLIIFITLSKICLSEMRNSKRVHDNC